MMLTVSVALTLFFSVTHCQNESRSVLFTSSVLPVFYDVTNFYEFEMKQIPKEIPVIMHLHLLHSVTDFSYFLRPALLPDIPVVTLGENGSEQKRIHRSDCHYEAWSLDEKGLSPGFVGVCDGHVEGVIPMNASHVWQIQPIHQLLKPRTNRHNGYSTISVHSVHLYPAKWNVNSVQRISRDYGDEMRKSVAVDVHHRTFWRKFHLLKKRKRRSLRTVSLDFSFPVVTTEGPFVMKLGFLIDSGAADLFSSGGYAPTQYLSLLVGIVNSLYRILDIRILPVTVFVHTKPQTVNNFQYDFSKINSGNVALRRLRKYFQTIGRLNDMDCVHLLTGREPFEGSSIGLAHVRVMCRGVWCNGLTTVQNAENFVYVASTMAHELGHNLGAEHTELVEDRGDCDCFGSDCLMSSHARIHAKLSDYSWSRCTVIGLKQLLDSGLRHCLKLHRSMPKFSSRWRIETKGGVPQQYCGNAIVEGDEECDCGGPVVCGDNNCCDAKTCKLKSGAKCAHGTCCDKKICKAKPAKTLCRHLSNECDLPEFCDGNSVDCPPDIVKANGELCSEGNFCHDGSCGNVNRMCRSVFGNQSILYTDDRVQCLSTPYSCTVDKNFDLSKQSPALPGNCRACYMQRNTFGICCRRHYNQPGLDLPPNGAACIINNARGMCSSGNCVKIVYDGHSECHGNGWLNSLGNCHCKSGWSPPNCTKSGNGGSIDSGPANPNWNPIDRVELDWNLLLPTGAKYSNQQIIIITICIVIAIVVIAIISGLIFLLTINTRNQRVIKCRRSRRRL